MEGADPDRARLALLLAALRARPRRRLNSRSVIGISLLVELRHRIGLSARRCGSARSNRERGKDGRAGWATSTDSPSRSASTDCSVATVSPPNIPVDAGEEERTARRPRRLPRREAAAPERLHGRHVLNRYEDGMEKCIGCELCAGVCPAECIHVRGADNDPENPTSPGERFGFIYEINYLRCIHCDMCVEACPTEAITEIEAVRVLVHQPPGTRSTPRRSWSSTTTASRRSALGGLARGRRRAHQRLDAGDVAVG